MSDERKVGQKVEGEPSKRYGVAYAGQTIGSYDTAQEAMEAYRKYEEMRRVSTEQTVTPKYEYSFRDGRTTITTERFRAAAKAEAKSKAKK